MLVPEALTGLAWRSSSICPSQRSNSACISSNCRHSSSMSSSWVFLWLTCDKASSQCSCNFSAVINQRPLPFVIFASFVLSNLWHHFDLLGNDVAIYLKHQIKLKLKLVNDVFILLTHQIKVKIKAGLKWIYTPLKLDKCIILLSHERIR